MTDYIKQVAEAVRDAVWSASAEGWNGEYPHYATPEVDLDAIIASVPVPGAVAYVDGDDVKRALR